MTHLRDLARALAAEEAWERAELERLLALSPSDQLAVGVAWPVLEVEEAVPAGHGRFLLTLRGREALHDGIRVGDAVTVLPSGGGGRGLPGHCVGVGRRVAEVRITSDDGVEGAMLVQRRFDPTTYRRYAEALDTAEAHPNRLADVLLGRRELSPQASNLPPLADGRLNDSQRQALATTMASGELALVHGPPGTGKTHLVTALLRTLVDGGDTPWALADSNAAVDHLALACHREGLQVVRVGHSARMSDEARAVSLATRLATSPLAGALAALERDRSRCADHRERRALGQRWRELRRDAEQHILEGAEVIACTFGTLAGRAEQLPPAHTALVVEATQATEPAVWVAVPHVQRLILAGDPEQLGPVCRVPGPLEVSLLERVLLEERAAAPMLEVQHRMDRGIRTLVARVYGDRYRDHPSAADQGLTGPGSSVRATDLTQRRALWIDTAGAGFDEERDPVSRSLRSPGEVRLVRAVVDHLVEAGVPTEDIAVIAPYSAQVAALRSALPGTEVATVNAYQGRERPVVVASWVRSNDRGELGFVADGRRLTVTLTRARRLLVSIGDSATLGAHPRFGRLLDDLADRGDLQSVFEPPWDAAL